MKRRGRAKRNEVVGNVETRKESSLSTPPLLRLWTVLDDVEDRSGDAQDLLDWSW